MQMGLQGTRWVPLILLIKHHIQKPKPAQQPCCFMLCVSFPALRFFADPIVSIFVFEPPMSVETNCSQVKLQDYGISQ